MSAVNLEVGKFYITECGVVTKITHVWNNKAEYRYHSDRKIRYNSNGSTLLGGITNDNIQSEVMVIPVFDNSQLTGYDAGVKVGLNIYAFHSVQD